MIVSAKKNHSDPERQGVKVFFEADEKSRWDQFIDDAGMIQKTAATRLFRWFLNQDEVIKKGILGVLPDSVVPDIARIVLERMAAQQDLDELDRRSFRGGAPQEGQPGEEDNGSDTDEPHDEGAA